MKLHELFPNTELTELNMSPSSLQSRASAIEGALVGLEFEMYVPGVGDVSGDVEFEPDYSVDRGIDTSNWRHFAKSVVDFFVGGDFAEGSRQWYERQMQQVFEEYFEWADSEFYVHVMDGDFEEWYKEENPDEDELPSKHSRAWDRAIDQFKEERFDDFMLSEGSVERWAEEQGIETFKDFADKFEWQWTHMTSGASEGDIAKVAEDFAEHVGMGVDVNTEYHQSRKSLEKYTVEPDGSLERPDDPDDAGLEFVSPPLPIQDIRTQLALVKKWADGYGAYTNKSCGLHMNVSIPNYDLTKLDYVKLALFVGDNWVLKQFDRLGSSWAQSSLNNVRMNLRNDPDKIPGYMEVVRQGLVKIASKLIHSGKTEKYVTLNTKDNRIEFRAPGGDWLNTDLPKLVNTMLRFVVALDVAMDPEKEKKEYYTKMYKLLDEARIIEDTDTLKFFAKYSAKQLPAVELKSFVRQAQQKRKAKGANPVDNQTKQIAITYFAASDGEEHTVKVSAENRREALEIFRKDFPDTLFSIVGMKEV